MPIPENIKQCRCGGTEFKFEGVQWFPEKYSAVLGDCPCKRDGEVGYPLFTCKTCGTTLTDKPNRE